MTADDFARYLAYRRVGENAHLEGVDPEVEMYDGFVRIFDQRGESMTLRRPFARQLRSLALQLEVCASEIDRRDFEQEPSPPVPATPRSD